MTERINAFLRSEAALLTLLAMALISQTPHTAVLFHRLSPTVNGVANTATWLHAVAYAIALEFATLVFVVRGQRKLAWLFAGVSIAVNLLYYAVGELTPIYILSALMVSIALPSSIAFYSHSVAEHTRTKSVTEESVTPITVESVTGELVAQEPEPMPESASGDNAPAATPKRKAKPKAKPAATGVTALARQLGVSRTTVYRKLNNGELHLNGTGD